MEIGGHRHIPGSIGNFRWDAASRPQVATLSILSVHSEILMYLMLERTT